MKNIEWFKQAQFGMMIHFGLYSILGGIYQEQKSGHYAEWIQSYFQIPNAEYEKLTQVFNPIYFDADKIVSYAQSWGMKYLVVTAKHHDGFALFQSEADQYNVVDATPFRRDLILELANACKKKGLKFGIYYSQDLDWHEKNGGGYLSNDQETAGTTWENSWDFKGQKDFNECFEQKMLPQIIELMTKYGKISTIWFDVPMTLSEKQSQLIYDTVKRYQPNCLINSRLGYGKYDYVSLGDNEIPKHLEVNEFNFNAINGIKPSPYGLYETAATLNHSWGYSYTDHDYKTGKELYQIKHHLNALGINYLLNIGLDGLGRIPVEAIQSLNELKELEEK